jgi:hypothetical protein
LDALLRDYFRSEMPDAWPALRLPEPVRRPLPQRRTFSARSRSLLALAAAVVFLIGGSWYLGGAPIQFAAPVPGLSEGGMGNASRINHQRLRDTNPGLHRGGSNPASR